MTSVDQLLAALTATGARAWSATDADTVDGVRATAVAAPTTTGQTADVMRVAAAESLAVVARGSGSRLDWGRAPRRVDLILDTTGLDAVLEHAAGDLIVSAQAGVRLDRLQAVLANAGQRLALDPVVGGAGTGTVGGIIATGAGGPLRLSHGAVRDLLIGITVVRADGVIAKAGGKVVKNVAGYDLAKLFAGSWGTLGVITEAVFRLHPVPQTAKWVTAEATGPEQLDVLVQRVVHSQVVASAVEIDLLPGSQPNIAVLLEGISGGVDVRTGSVLGLLGDGARVSELPPPWWGRQPWPAGGTGVKLTCEIAGAGRLAAAVEQISATRGVRAALGGSPGVGVLYLGLPPDTPPGSVAAVVGDLRVAATAWGGDVVVLTGPAAVKSALDVWGPVSGLHLMRRIKDRFDPERRLAPDRFVEGI